MSSRTLEEIDAEAVEVARQLKRARAKADAQQHRCDRGGFSARTQQVALALYLLRDDAAVAARFLEQQLRSQDDGASTLSSTDLVLTWFLDAEPETLEALADAETPAAKHINDVARTFLAEYDVVGWVRKVNAKGVAPSSAALAGAFEAEAEAKASPRRAGRCARDKRRWTQRFRQRWCLARKAPPTKPPLEGHALEVKARTSVFCCS